MRCAGDPYFCYPYILAEAGVGRGYEALETSKIIPGAVPAQFIA